MLWFIWGLLCQQTAGPLWPVLKKFWRTGPLLFNDKIYSYIYQKKNYFGTWQFGMIDGMVNFIVQKFTRLKSKHFSQFFLWEVQVQASVFERQKKKFCYPSLNFWKNTLLKYICQLEKDHMTQQPKETCQRTCRGPTFNKISLYGWGINVKSSSLFRDVGTFLIQCISTNE